MMIFKHKKTGNLLIKKVSGKDVSTFYLLDNDKMMIATFDKNNSIRKADRGAIIYEVMLCDNKNVEEVYYTSAEIKEFVRNAYFDNLITQPKIQ